VHPPADTDSGSEAWIGSVTRTNNAGKDKPANFGCSEVVLPDGRQMFLFEAIALAPEEILGKDHYARHGTNLGMLIKYLDAQKQYGLQAHPTRPFAKKMWNSDFGKEESWYVIGVRDDCPPAYILLGFKEGVTRAQMEALADKDDMAGLENLCHRIPVKVGEAYFVGGGVPHALGEGCFVVEVQEPCDITVVPIRQSALAKRWPGYKSEDDAIYNEKAFGSFVYDGCSYEENLKRWRIPQRIIRQGDWGKEYFIIGPQETSYFSYTQIDLESSAPISDTGFPQVAIVLRGDGKLFFDGGELSVSQGDEIFLPHNIPGIKARGKFSIVLCHPEGAFAGRKL
jgi:mannose-6-phosphate isomerase